MAIYRLFDPDPGAISLGPRNELRQKLDAAQNQTFRRKLGSIEDVAERVSALRNQMFDIAAIFPLWLPSMKPI